MCPSVCTESSKVCEDVAEKQGSKTPTSKPEFSPETVGQRLNEHPTLSSTRRRSEFTNPLAPADSLDFQLKATYDHHRDWCKTNAEALLQEETVDESQISSHASNKRGLFKKTRWEQICSLTVAQTFALIHGSHFKHKVTLRVSDY
ncbi:unnamed protein product [Calicophoron daubneyi]|uniref:Uncharacterized protein n=1 Tax=Calicophoron daubneyi TaxID=300641 RepID=A0AAV2TC86_CALDB